MEPREPTHAAFFYQVRHGDGRRLKLEKKKKTREKERREEIKHVCVRESVLLRLRLNPTIVSNEPTKVLLRPARGNRY